MNIKYVVRTIPSRTLDKSFEQIDFDLFIDTKHSAWDSFVDALEKYSNFDLVLLEDDIILCRDFKNRIEQVISTYPNTIINFYSAPLEYFNTTYSNCFCYNQCTYFPKGLIKNIIKTMREDRLRYKTDKHYESYELSLREALRKLKIAHLIYRPCLVQHNDKDSTLSRSRTERITPYFIDYLEDLNLKYFSPEIVFKTTELLKYRNEKLNLKI